MIWTSRHKGRLISDGNPVQHPKIHECAVPVIIIDKGVFFWDRKTTGPILSASPVPQEQESLSTFRALANGAVWECKCRSRFMLNADGRWRFWRRF